MENANQVKPAQSLIAIGLTPHLSLTSIRSNTLLKS